MQNPVLKKRQEAEVSAMSRNSGRANMGHLQQQMQFKQMQQDAATVKMMMEEPDLFDYDGDYDRVQAARKEQQVSKKTEKKESTLISVLLAAKNKRERETLIRKERLAEKELNRCDDPGMKDERYVTSSYLKALEENKKFEDEDKKKEELNDKRSALNQGSMENFHKKLLEGQKLSGRIDLSKEGVQRNLQRSGGAGIVGLPKGYNDSKPQEDKVKPIVAAEDDRRRREDNPTEARREEKSTEARREEKIVQRKNSRERSASYDNKRRGESRREGTDDRKDSTRRDDGDRRRERDYDRRRDGDKWRDNEDNRKRERDDDRRRDRDDGSKRDREESDRHDRKDRHTNERRSGEGAAVISSEDKAAQVLREEKIRLAKERLLQRKQGQSEVQPQQP